MPLLRVSNQETAHLRAVSLAPGLSLKGGGMKKSSAWKMACIVCMFCAAAVIASPAQTFTTLVNFAGANGAHPQASLIQGTDGNFYGTTEAGGTSGNCSGGCGTVFKITAGGTLTTLHSFDGTDGAYPSAGLVQATDGNFYGTTEGGGASGNCSGGCGTVFKITPGGTLTTLYSFNSSDGDRPSAGLVQASDGNFYGTTYYGGTSNNCGGYACGTVFKISPGGTLTTLYSFCAQTGCPDGASPHAGLV